VNKIVLAIHEKPVLGEVACGPLIESYSFVFHYNEEGDYIMKLQRETNKTGELFKIETSRDEVRIKMGRTPPQQYHDSCNISPPLVGTLGFWQSF